MKCTSRKIFLLTASLSLLLTGCGQAQFAMPYTVDSEVSSFRIVNHEEESETADPFAAGLCVVNSNISPESVDMSGASGAGLFDLNGHNTLYAKNVHERLYPASLTKVMTALVALKYGSPDDVYEAAENVKITESGAVLCGLKPGDKMTLDQALHILLMYSANDVAILIAEGVSGGSVDDFVTMMNEEAVKIGATNCHFLNPNGLTQEGHYVTAYDLYLIFQEALQYKLFNEIIQTSSYNTVYMDANGADKPLEIENTNLYLRGAYEMPSNVTVVGGKTGTTSAAGHCLILLSRSSSGTPYISVILKDDSREKLYGDMTALLEIAK